MASQMGMEIYFFFHPARVYLELIPQPESPILREQPPPHSSLGKAENADSSAFSWEREELGRFLPGDPVTLAAQGSGVAFMMFLAMLSQGYDELALHKQKCHRQW